MKSYYIQNLLVEDQLLLRAQDYSDVTIDCQLESYIDNMVELGPESNDNLRRLFNDLYNGMMDNRERQWSPVCLWQNCTESTVYKDVEELYRHSKTHIDTSQVAPIDRCYECRMLKTHL